MKKWIAMLLCLVTVLSLLAACTEKPPATNPEEIGGGNTSETPADTSEDPTDKPEDPVPPPPPPKPVITIGLPENANVNYENNSYIRLIEELSGCEIEFVYFQSLPGDYLQQLSLRVRANEKLPDILWGFDGMSASVRDDYGKDGVFQDLTAYFQDQEKSAIFWERLGQLPEAEQTLLLKGMTSLVDGKIYSFPHAALAEENVCAFMPWINKTWLDRLNLPMPTDVKSLETVLYAFKNQDPNGDGKKNDIPCLVQADGDGARGLDYFINLYLYLDTTTGWFELDGNGNVLCTATTEKYREALIWVNKLVKDGVIHKNSFSMGANDIAQFFQNDGVNRLGMTVTNVSGGMKKDHTNVLMWVPLECMTYAPLVAAPHTYGTFITKHCRNVDAAWSVLMAMCTREAQLHNAYGQKDVHWTDADADGKTATGEPAEIKIINGGDKFPTNHRLVATGAGIDTPVRVQYVEDPEISEAARYKTNVLLPEMVKLYQEKAEANNPEEKYICPLLIFNKQDQQAAPGAKFLPGIFEEWRTKFMYGDKDPGSEKDWAAYLQELEKAGLADYLETAQAIYDRDHKN